MERANSKVQPWVRLIEPVSEFVSGAHLAIRGDSPPARAIESAAIEKNGSIAMCMNYRLVARATTVYERVRVKEQPHAIHTATKHERRRPPPHSSAHEPCIYRKGHYMRYILFLSEIIPRAAPKQSAGACLFLITFIALGAEDFCQPGRT